MIYGLNFGAPDIPPSLKQKFKARIEREIEGQKLRLCLSGVCQNSIERFQMEQQAEAGAVFGHGAGPGYNGKRKLYWVHKQIHLGGRRRLFSGLYVY